MRRKQFLALIPLVLGLMPLAGAVELPVDPKVEIALDRPIANGPCAPNWKSLGDFFNKTPPPWWREAKIGFWIHWGPQSLGRSGDWYARFLYQQKTRSKYYNNHLKNFGHPSEFGYKDVLNQWRPAKWNPAELMDLYKRAGAGYVLIMGVHHDNFDLWNSKFQPWNSVNVGPKRDILRAWITEAKRCNMRYGVSFHHDYSWFWYQTAFQSDSDGSKAGVPYDAAVVTKASGKGTWWEGLDPKDLYGINLQAEYVPGRDPRTDFGGWGHTKDLFTTPEVRQFACWYAQKWFDRVKDVVDNYRPDFIYFDGNTYPFSGGGTGRGIKTDGVARIAAHFFNSQVEWHDGRNEGMVFTKGARRDDRAVMRCEESSFPKDILLDPWVCENGLGEWFYEAGTFYDSGMVIHEMLEAVSRDGNFQVNIPLDPDGQLDPGGRQVLEDMAAWMDVNGVGVKGSHAWKVWGEGAVVMGRGNLKQSHAKVPYTGKDIRFTVGKDGALYAYAMAWPADGKLVITSLAAERNLWDGAVGAVKLLGSDAKLTWIHDATGLVITLPAEKPKPGNRAYGFRITGLPQGSK